MDKEYEKIGVDVVKYLAEIYEQLYITPDEINATILYDEIVKRGKHMDKKMLSHFITSPDDRCFIEETPAGSVRIVVLANRVDFETFLTIMSNKCVRKSIPIGQGATIIDGIINWRKIESHKTKYISSMISQNAPLDWSSEFKRFTSDKHNFKDTIIILSCGPYSAVSADKLGLSNEEWLAKSYIIRQYHECTHFICRKLYPDKIDVVWDEIVADTVGIYAAFGYYKKSMASLFLGIDNCGYVGGRLENYLDKEKIDIIAFDIYMLLDKFENFIAKQQNIPPYELIIKLEEQKTEWWDNIVNVGGTKQ